MRVDGHYLSYEGAPHDERGHLKYQGGYIHRGGSGRAKCSCGEISPEMDSGKKRQQWHREHKEEVAQNARQVAS